MGQDSTKALGRFIAAMREQSELSQETFAKKAGIGRNALANIETGRRQIGIEQLLSIARALDIEPYLLLDVYRFPTKSFPKAHYRVEIGTLTNEKLRLLSKLLKMDPVARLNTEQIIDLLNERDKQSRKK